MNIFDNYLPMPECNKEYYSIWLENGSDSHGIEARREGCAEGEAAAPGAGLEGVPRVPKRSTKLLFYGIRLVCFSEKSLFIDVCGTLSLSPSHSDGYTSSNNNNNNNGDLKQLCKTKTTNRTCDSIYSYFNVFIDIWHVTSCVLLLLCDG